MKTFEEFSGDKTITKAEVKNLDSYETFLSKKESNKEEKKKEKSSQK